MLNELSGWGTQVCSGHVNPIPAQVPTDQSIQGKFKTITEGKKKKVKISTELLCFDKHCTKVTVSTCKYIHLLLWLFEYTPFHLFTAEQWDEFVFLYEISIIMFFLAAACTISRTQLKLHSVHTECQWLLSIISPVVWLMGIKLCRTLLTNKVKSNKSRQKRWKTVCMILSCVHYLQHE